MSKLFTPFRINRLTIPNRIMRSATWEGMADNKGLANAAMTDFYRRLAKGGVGLIVSGYAYVMPNGKSLPGQTGLYADDHIEGLARIAEAVHEEGGLFFVQIVHGGGQTNAETIGSDDIIAPSSMFYPSNKVTPRAIERDEIPVLIAAFASAARRARQAGCDGVQLHAAHGYLINRFLSPVTNQRTDAYGGSLENRARFGLETIEALRREVGPDFPISMKLNACDFEEGGLSADDSLAAAKLFVAAGLDHLELSGGTPAAGKLGAVRRFIDAPDKEAYFREFVAAFTKQLPIPVSLVGGIRSIEIAEDIVDSGDAAGVSMCRPLICEPGLPARWRSGERAPARCKSDGGCYVAGLKGGIRCTTFQD
jgi:2,4-dienoyl-CoA reductase-like NADH-dependent reductase (Old Yellow Enzyme family)